MTTIRRFLVVLSVLSVTVPAAAQGLAPKKAGDLVTLVHTPGSNCGQSFQNGIPITTRILPDGTSVPFAIPEGQVLVLTGISWNLQGPFGFNAAFLTLFLHVEAVPLSVRIFHIGETPDGPISAAGSTDIPNIVMGSAATPCVLSTASTLLATTLHGFLAPDK
jgi:hypothetical protein